MKNLSPWIAVSSIVAAALLCLAAPATGFAQSYKVRPTCSPNGQCQVDPSTFGYNDTSWRQWPGQPRPEQRNSGAVGGDLLPTPAPLPEQALPHAESLPAKPSISGGGTGGSILPSPGSLPGATAPDSLKIDGTSPNPNQNLPVPAPQGLKGILDGLDIAPQPEAVPKPGGSGGTPLAPPKGPLLPEAAVPETPAPTPGTPATEPAKTRDKGAATPKSSLLPPDVAPAPAAKPDATSPGSKPVAPSPAAKSDAPSRGGKTDTPSPAAKPVTPSPAAKPDELLPDNPPKRSSLSGRGKDAIAAEPSPSQDDMPIRADWNASLGPETVGGSQQRTVSFEQSALETANPLRSAPERCNPLRSALEGYCPVQLRENDRWVAGKPDLQATYQGQVFYFSSEIARKRFKATPEKYAPIQGGSDIVLAAEENRAVPGTVNHSAVWRGRLYLFASSETLATFQEDPARYAN